MTWMDCIVIVCSMSYVDGLVRGSSFWVSILGILSSVVYLLIRWSEIRQERRHDS